MSDSAPKSRAIRAPTRIKGSPRDCRKDGSCRVLLGTRQVGSASEPEHECERVLRPGPVFAHDGLTAAADEAAKNERNDYDVVELTRHRDEVGHEVEGEREVPGQRDQERLLSPGHPRVMEQTGAENDAVGDEAG